MKDEQSLFGRDGILRVLSRSLADKLMLAVIGTGVVAAFVILAIGAVR
jgi:hypothetical protein